MSRALRPSYPALAALGASLVALLAVAWMAPDRAGHVYDSLSGSQLALVLAVGAVIWLGGVASLWPSSLPFKGLAGAGRSAEASTAAAESVAAPSGAQRRSPLTLALESCRQALVAVGLFSLGLNLLMLTIPLYMLSVYDRVLSSHSQETLLMLTLIAVGALALGGALEAVRQIVLMRAGARLETALGGRVLEASLSLRAHERRRHPGPARPAAGSPVPLLAAVTFFDAPVAPLYMALIFIIHPHLGWLTLGAGDRSSAVSLLNQRLTRRPLAEAAPARHRRAAEGAGHARNAEVVRAMGMLSNCVASWGEANARAMIASDQAGAPRRLDGAARASCASPAGLDPRLRRLSRADPQRAHRRHHLRRLDHLVARARADRPGGRRLAQLRLGRRSPGGG